MRGAPWMHGLVVVALLCLATVPHVGGQTTPPPPPDATTAAAAAATPPPAPTGAAVSAVTCEGAVPNADFDAFVDAGLTAVPVVVPAVGSVGTPCTANIKCPFTHPYVVVRWQHESEVSIAVTLPNGTRVTRDGGTSFGGAEAFIGTEASVTIPSTVATKPLSDDSVACLRIPCQRSLYDAPDSTALDADGVYDVIALQKDARKSFLTARNTLAFPVGERCVFKLPCPSWTFPRFVALRGTGERADFISDSPVGAASDGARSSDPSSAATWGDVLPFTGYSDADLSRRAFPPTGDEDRARYRDWDSIGFFNSPEFHQVKTLYLVLEHDANRPFFNATDKPFYLAWTCENRPCASTSDIEGSNADRGLSIKKLVIDDQFNQNSRCILNAQCPWFRQIVMSIDNMEDKPGCKDIDWDSCKSQTDLGLPLFERFNDRLRPACSFVNFTVFDDQSAYDRRAPGTPELPCRYSISAKCLPVCNSPNLTSPLPRYIVPANEQEITILSDPDGPGMDSVPTFSGCSFPAECTQPDTFLTFNLSGTLGGVANMWWDYGPMNELFAGTLVPDELVPPSASGPTDLIGLVVPLRSTFGRMQTLNSFNSRDGPPGFGWSATVKCLVEPAITCQREPPMVWTGTPQFREYEGLIPFLDQCRYDFVCPADMFAAVRVDLFDGYRATGRYINTIVELFADDDGLEPIAGLRQPPGILFSDTNIARFRWLAEGLRFPQLGSYRMTFDCYQHRCPSNASTVVIDNVTTAPFEVFNQWAGAVATNASEPREYLRLVNADCNVSLSAADPSLTLGLEVESLLYAPVFVVDEHINASFVEEMKQGDGFDRLDADARNERALRDVLRPRGYGASLELVAENRTGPIEHTPFEENQRYDLITETRTSFGIFLWKRSATLRYRSHRFVGEQPASLSVTAAAYHQPCSMNFTSAALEVRPATHVRGDEANDFESYRAFMGERCVVNFTCPNRLHHISTEIRARLLDHDRATATTPNGEWMRGLEYEENGFQTDRTTPVAVLFNESVVQVNVSTTTVGRPSTFASLLAGELRHVQVLCWQSRCGDNRSHPVRFNNGSSSGQSVDTELHPTTSDGRSRPQLLNERCEWTFECPAGHYAGVAFDALLEGDGIEMEVGFRRYWNTDPSINREWFTGAIMAPGNSITVKTAALLYDPNSTSFLQDLFRFQGPMSRERWGGGVDYDPEYYDGNASATYLRFDCFPTRCSWAAEEREPLTNDGRSLMQYSYTPFDSGRRGRSGARMPRVTYQTEECYRDFTCVDSTATPYMHAYSVRSAVPQWLHGSAGGNVAAGSRPTNLRVDEVALLNVTSGAVGSLPPQQHPTALDSGDFTRTAAWPGVMTTDAGARFRLWFHPNDTGIVRFDVFAACYTSRCCHNQTQLWPAPISSSSPQALRAPRDAVSGNEQCNGATVNQWCQWVAPVCPPAPANPQPGVTSPGTSVVTFPPDVTTLLEPSDPTKIRERTARFVVPEEATRVVIEYAFHGRLPNETVFPSDEYVSAGCIRCNGTRSELGAAVNPPPGSSPSTWAPTSTAPVVRFEGQLDLEYVCRAVFVCDPGFTVLVQLGSDTVTATSNGDARIGVIDIRPDELEAALGNTNTTAGVMAALREYVPPPIGAYVNRSTANGSHASLLAEARYPTRTGTFTTAQPLPPSGSFILSSSRYLALDIRTVRVASASRYPQASPLQMTHMCTRRRCFDEVTGRRANDPDDPATPKSAGETALAALAVEDGTLVTLPKPPVVGSVCHYLLSSNCSGTRCSFGVTTDLASRTGDDMLALERASARNPATLNDAEFRWRAWYYSGFGTAISSGLVWSSVGGARGFGAPDQFVIRETTGMRFTVTTPPAAIATFGSEVPPVHIVVDTRTMTFSLTKSVAVSESNTDSANTESWEQTDTESESMSKSATILVTASESLSSSESLSPTTTQSATASEVESPSHTLVATATDSASESATNSLQEPTVIITPSRLPNKVLQRDALPPVSVVLELRGTTFRKDLHFDARVPTAAEVTQATATSSSNESAVLDVPVRDAAFVARVRNEFHAAVHLTPITAVRIGSLATRRDAWLRPESLLALGPQTAVLHLFPSDRLQFVDGADDVVDLVLNETILKTKQWSTIPARFVALAKPPPSATDQIANWSPLPSTLLLRSSPRAALASRALQRLVNGECDHELDEELPTYVYPLGFPLGEGVLRYHAGCALYNLVLSLGILLAQKALTHAVSLLGRMPFAVAAGHVRYPAVGLLLGLFLIQDSLQSATTVLMLTFDNDTVNAPGYPRQDTWVFYVALAAIVTWMAATVGLAVHAWRFWDAALMRVRADHTKGESMQRFFLGTHEWEDDALLSEHKGVARWGMHLDAFTKRSGHIYMAIEMAITIALGIVSALLMDHGDCTKLSAAMVVIFAVYVVATLACRPYLVPFDMAFSVLLVIGQFGAALVLLSASVSDRNAAQATEKNNTMLLVAGLSIFVMMMASSVKALVDIAVQALASGVRWSRKAMLKLERSKRTAMPQQRPRGTAAAATAAGTAASGSSSSAVSQRTPRSIAAEQVLIDSLARGPPPPPPLHSRDTNEAPLLSVPVAPTGHMPAHQQATNPVAASFAQAPPMRARHGRGRFDDLLNSSSDDLATVAAGPAFAAAGRYPAGLAEKGGAAVAATADVSGRSRRQQRRQQQRRQRNQRAEDLDDVMGGGGASGRMIDVAAPVVFSKEPHYSDL